jgi:hypothetical protein
VADSSSLALEVLDDGGSDAVTLEARKDLNAGQLDAGSCAGDPQPADTLVTDLDHARHAAGNRTTDLIDGPRTELLAKGPLVEVVALATLGTRRLDHHVGEKPDVVGGGCPQAVLQHERMVALLNAGRHPVFSVPAISRNGTWTRVHGADMDRPSPSGIGHLPAAMRDQRRIDYRRRPVAAIRYRGGAHLS